MKFESAIILFALLFFCQRETSKNEEPPAQAVFLIGTRIVSRILEIRASLWLKHPASIADQHSLCGWHRQKHGPGAGQLSFAWIALACF